MVMASRVIVCKWGYVPLPLVGRVGLAGEVAQPPGLGTGPAEARARVASRTKVLASMLSVFWGYCLLVIDRLEDEIGSGLVGDPDAEIYNKVIPVAGDLFLDQVDWMHAVGR